MQKFTVFSLLLSFTVLLIIGDLILNDYLGQDNFDGKVENLQNEINDLNGVTKENEALSVPVEQVEFSSENSEAVLSKNLLENAGFEKPVLKEAPFSGYVFQFINFADDSDGTTKQWNFFEGETYIGSFYEIKYINDIGSFQAYLNLRKRAAELTEIGTVNETNTYGDSSFYLNHKVKTKTVHLIIKKGSVIFAFEYPYANHERMKKLFDLL